MVTIMSILTILVLRKIGGYDLLNREYLFSIVITLLVSSFSQINNPISIVLISVLSYLIFVDLNYEELPNSSLLICLICVFLTNNINQEIIIGATYYLVLFSAISIITGGTIGSGDIKLSFIVGLILTKQLFLTYITVVFVIGAAVGISLVLLKIKKREEMIPFGPFMILAMFLLI